jgi:hypothetical protein
MAPKEPKISKQAAAGTTDITLTILNTLKLIRKPENATRQSIIMTAYKIILLTIYGTIKHKKLLPVRT